MFSFFRSYLVDLMETVHLFLKMLEHFCKKTGLVVQKKVRKKKSKPKSKFVLKNVKRIDRIFCLFVQAKQKNDDF